MEGLRQMRREEVLAYGLSFPDTYQDAPFHDANWQLVRYKGNRKAFLWTYEKDGFLCLNVKVLPEKAFFTQALGENCEDGRRFGIPGPGQLRKNAIRYM